MKSTFRVFALGCLAAAFVVRNSAGQELAGTVDPSFDAGQFFSAISYMVLGYGKVIGLALGPNYEIYIGGHFTAFKRFSVFKDWNGIARLNPDGSLDDSFAVPILSLSFTPSTRHIDAHDIFVQRDRTVWVGIDAFLGDPGVTVRSMNSSREAFIT